MLLSICTILHLPINGKVTLNHFEFDCIIMEHWRYQSKPHRSLTTMCLCSRRLKHAGDAPCRGSLLHTLTQRVGGGSHGKRQVVHLMEVS